MGDLWTLLWYIIYYYPQDAHWMMMPPRISFDVISKWYHTYLKAVIGKKNVQDVWSLFLGKVTCPELQNKNVSPFWEKYVFVILYTKKSLNIDIFHVFTKIQVLNVILKIPR